MTQIVLNVDDASLVPSLKHILGSIKGVTIDNLIPADDTLMSEEEFLAKLERGEEEHRQGRCVRLMPGETVSQMLRRSGL